MEEYKNRNVSVFVSVPEPDVPRSSKLKFRTYGSCFIENHPLDPTDDACCMRHFRVFTFETAVGGPEPEKRSKHNVLPIYLRVIGVLLNKSGNQMPIDLTRRRFNSFLGSCSCFIYNTHQF